MTKSATLTSGLVSKKGQASPAITTEVALNTANYYKALTVKLDRERYESLKNLGVKLDKKSQEIFVEALDIWIKQTRTQMQ
jgi:hypothetical protein